MLHTGLVPTRPPVVTAVAWHGRLSRGSVLLLASGVRLVCLLASGTSVEMAALAPIALVGWIVLAPLLRRRTAVAWLGR